MPVINTGYLEDDFCANLKVILDAGVADSSIPRLKEINAAVPVSDNGPYPNAFIHWVSTVEGDKSSYAYPYLYKHYIITGRVVVVNNTFDKVLGTEEVRDILRKIADYIDTHTTINGFCVNARTTRIESGETAFLRTSSILLSSGVVELEGEVIHTLNHS